MTETDGPVWCRDDSPHGEHWRQNAFNDRDYCSGRPDVRRKGPVTDTDDLLDEQATYIADMQRRIDDLSAELVRLDDRRKREVHSASERGRIYANEIANVKAERDSWHQAALTATGGESRAELERDEARAKLDKVRGLADEAPPHLLDELRTLLAILDGDDGR